MTDSPFSLVDLGVMPYPEALAVQRAHVEEVLASRDSGTPEVGRVLIVEHPPVITVSHRPNATKHLLADSGRLMAEGVAVEPTDRGGDITYHGPGQLVVYPILDLNVLGLRLHEYMRLLESVVIDTCLAFGVQAIRDATATGVWIPSPDDPSDAHAKVCAMGVRVRRWVSMHGLAINVSTNLKHFDLIVPCGLVGRPVTSIRELLGERCPSMELVKRAVADTMATHVRAQLQTHNSL